MRKIIAIHSYKGGTGKTMVSTNLAAIYAKEGKDVCLLDLDFRAPSLHVPFKNDEAKHSLNDYLNGVCKFEKVLTDFSQKYSLNGKLRVGLADPSTEAIREMSAKDRKWEMKALGRLLSLKTFSIHGFNPDYIIFDTSPGLQYSSINAIVSADIVLVITTRDASDIEGTHRMIHELYDLFEKKTGIIFNKVAAQILFSKAEKRDLKKQLLNKYKLPILEFMPCTCEILLAQGTKIFAIENPEHPVVKTLEKVAAKIKKF